jgi:hypothetical protein
MSSTLSAAQLLIEHRKMVQLCLETIYTLYDMHPLIIASPLMNRTIRLLVDVTVRLENLYLVDRSSLTFGSRLLYHSNPASP